MGYGSLCSFRVTAALYYNDRFYPGRSPCSGHELSGMGDRLYIEKDGPGMIVIRQIVKHIPKIDVGHITQGN